MKIDKESGSNLSFIKIWFIVLFLIVLELFTVQHKLVFELPVNLSTGWVIAYFLAGAWIFLGFALVLSKYIKSLHFKYIIFYMVCFIYYRLKFFFYIDHST